MCCKWESLNSCCVDANRDQSFQLYGVLPCPLYVCGEMQMRKHGPVQESSSTSLPQLTGTHLPRSIRMVTPWVFLPPTQQHHASRRPREVSHCFTCDGRIGRRIMCGYLVLTGYPWYFANLQHTLPHSEGVSLLSCKSESHRKYKIDYPARYHSNISTPIRKY